MEFFQTGSGYLKSQESGQIKRNSLGYVGIDVSVSHLVCIGQGVSRVTGVADHRVEFDELCSQAGFNVALVFHWGSFAKATNQI